jgi:hypothetical protein
VDRDNKTKIITATVEYMKDGEAGISIHSELQGVDLGCDDDGNPITSCVILPVDHAPNKPLKGDLRTAYQALCECINEVGKPDPSSARSGTKMTCPASVWRARFYQLKMSSSDKRDSKKRAFNRAAKELKELDFIDVYDDVVWLTGQVGQGGTK